MTLYNTILRTVYIILKGKFIPFPNRGFFLKKPTECRKRYFRAGWEYGAEIWSHDLSLAKFSIFVDENFVSTFFTHLRVANIAPTSQNQPKPSKNRSKIDSEWFCML